MAGEIEPKRLRSDDDDDDGDDDDADGTGPLQRTPLPTAENESQSK